jgi:DNA-binding MarR family transcriptional regulator
MTRVYLRRISLPVGKIITRATPPAKSANAAKHYFQSVAEARFVARQVFRLVDERAKVHGLEALEHQALIQIYGAKSDEISVGEVAARLHIVAAFGSKLVKKLVQKELVRSRLSELDQRVVHLSVTAKGAKLLSLIDTEVRMHVDYFTQQLAPEQKEAAIAIFAFYVGTSVRILDHTRSMEQSLLKGIKAG